MASVTMGSEPITQLEYGIMDGATWMHEDKEILEQLTKEQGAEKEWAEMEGSCIKQQEHEKVQEQIWQSEEEDRQLKDKEIITENERKRRERTDREGQIRQWEEECKQWEELKRAREEKEKQWELQEQIFKKENGKLSDEGAVTKPDNGPRNSSRVPFSKRLQRPADVCIGVKEGPDPSFHHVSSSAAEILEVERTRDYARLLELKESYVQWKREQRLHYKLKEQKYQREIKRLEARQRAYRRAEHHQLDRLRSEDKANFPQKRKTLKRSGTSLSWTALADSDDVFEPPFKAIKCEKYTDKQLTIHGLSYRDSGTSVSQSELSYQDIATNKRKGTFSKSKCTIGKKDIHSRHSHCCASKSGLPTLQLPKFSGDPLEFPQFKLKFEARVASKVDDMVELLSYLLECLDGMAAELMVDIWAEGADKGYRRAWQILYDNCGDSRLAANKLMAKVINWNDIAHEDYQSLKEFSQLLERCYREKKSSAELAALDSHYYIVQIVEKLSDVIRDDWLESVARLKAKEQRFPAFKDVVRFVSYQSEIANYPLYGRITIMRQGCLTEDAPQTSRETHLVNSFNTGQNYDKPSPPKMNKYKVAGKCLYCQVSHSLDDCSSFMDINLANRKNFLILNKLCFACLKVGHVAGQCPERLTCRVCQKRHATCLHHFGSWPFNHTYMQQQVALSSSRVGISMHERSVSF